MISLHSHFFHDDFYILSLTDIFVPYCSYVCTKQNKNDYTKYWTPAWFTLKKILPGQLETYILQLSV